MIARCGGGVCGACEVPHACVHAAGGRERGRGARLFRRGKFLLSSSDPDISAEDVALGYKNLLEAERSFRNLKGIPRLRPVYHRLEERIRAHIVICWLALLLIRLIERPAADTWRDTRRELEPCTSSPSRAPPAKSNRPRG